MDRAAMGGCGISGNGGVDQLDTAPCIDRAALPVGCLVVDEGTVGNGHVELISDDVDRAACFRHTIGKNAAGNGDFAIDARIAVDKSAIKGDIAAVAGHLSINDPDTVTALQEEQTAVTGAERHFRADVDGGNVVAEAGIFNEQIMCHQLSVVDIQETASVMDRALIGVHGNGIFQIVDIPECYGMKQTIQRSCAQFDHCIERDRSAAGTGDSDIIFPDRHIVHRHTHTVFLLRTEIDQSAVNIYEITAFKLHTVVFDHAVPDIKICGIVCDDIGIRVVDAGISVVEQTTENFRRVVDRSGVVFGDQRNGVAADRHIVEQDIAAGCEQTAGNITVDVGCFAIGVNGNRISGNGSFVQGEADGFFVITILVFSDETAVNIHALSAVCCGSNGIIREDQFIDGDETAVTDHCTIQAESERTGCCSYSAVIVLYRFNSGGRECIVLPGDGSSEGECTIDQRHHHTAAVVVGRITVGKDSIGCKIHIPESEICIGFKIQIFQQECTAQIVDTAGPSIQRHIQIVNQHGTGNVGIQQRDVAAVVTADIECRSLQPVRRT